LAASTRRLLGFRLQASGELLRLLALQVLLVFVLLDFPRAHLLQTLFLFFALALGVAGFLLPGRPLFRDFGLQLLFLAGVILHHLIERRTAESRSTSSTSFPER
jgi:hypothetical protein